MIDKITNKHLDLLMLQIFPNSYIKNFVTTSKDIYTYRTTLKLSQADEDVLSYLLTIIKNDIELGNRFKTLHCLKAIKIMVKKFSNNRHQFLPENLRKLFFLFQNFIYHKNEEIQNCVNIYIKEQQLNDSEMDWLIKNYHLSTHITNRLLRYPGRHAQIGAWALEVLKQKKLQDRISEIIGLLIEQEVPKDVSATPTQIVWAIYFSKTSNEIKEKLLRERFSIEQFDDIFKISQRLGYIEVCVELIEFMRKKLIEQ